MEQDEWETLFLLSFCSFFSSVDTSEEETQDL